MGGEREHGHDLGPEGPRVVDRRPVGTGVSSAQASILRLQSVAGNAATLAALSGPAPVDPGAAVADRILRTCRGTDDDPVVRRDVDLTDGQKDQYADMGDMGAYTKRKTKPGSVKEGGINEALAVLPRKADGSLTPEAIDAIEAFEKGEWDRNYDAWMNERMPDPERKKTFFGGIESDKDFRKRVAAAAKKLLAGDLNEVTDKTKNPELKNLEAPNGQPDANIAEAKTFSGVGVTINHNTSDVNAPERIAMIAAAIQKIVDAGGTFGGGLVFNLPKYGRKISMSKDCSKLEVTNFGTRAVFVAPKYVHLSSEILGNPNEATEQTQGHDRLSYLSAKLDPDGVASVVHELGHYCHYTSSPSQFHLLSGAGWANQEASQRAVKVSAYASGNPRELVAEVFLGLVYGQAYDDQTLEMYRKLGGMPVGAARAVAVPVGSVGLVV